MPRSDNIETEGVVEECLPGTKFKVKLDNGAVVERGTHEELYAKNGVYTQLVTNE